MKTINVSNGTFFSKINLGMKSYYYLYDLKDEYPGFAKWFFTKAIKGLLLGNREFLLCFSGGEIAGLAILKKESSEKKICTLRVSPRYRGRGLGSMLLESSIDYLGVDDPFITVPQQHIDEFRPLLSKFNFVEKGKFPNYYRNGSCEFCFNGLLERQYQGEEKSLICDFALARHCSEVGCCDGLLSVR